MKPSIPIEEYLAQQGWSSHHFLEHAKAIFSDSTIQRSMTFEIHRTVIYIQSYGKMLKGYVHHAGRSREFLTFKNAGGDEVKSFHYSVSTNEIKQFLLDYFSGRIDDPETPSQALANKLKKGRLR